MPNVFTDFIYRLGIRTAPAYRRGSGGGIREAEHLNVPLLGQIPIDIQTRERGDSGAPVALVSPRESKVSAAFHQLAATVIARVPTL